MACPICRKPALAPYRPFCSRRCADIDLGQWLTGGYSIPADAALDDAEETSDGFPQPPPPRH